MSEHEEFYLGAIDPDRCAACAAWPDLPCAQHASADTEVTP